LRSLQATEPAFIDWQPAEPIFGAVIRFILSWLVALSLIGGAPAVAAMAAPPPAAPQASECTMPGGDVPDQPTDHGKMPCCTSDCTMAGTAGLAQRDSVNLGELRFSD
jgi:hypothetical protein